MSAAFIIEAARTPIGRAHPEKGAYRDTHPNTLLAACLTALVTRAGVDPAEVEDVIVGCTAPFGEQGRNIARNAWLQAGYPVEVPAVTIDRRCGSSQSAVGFAAALIASGVHDLVIAAGIEHMQHVPIDSPVRVEELFGDPWTPQLRDRFEFIPMGVAAERIAERWEISRDEMDELAVHSHARAASATEAGHFAAETVPVETPHGGVTADQGIRPGTTREAIAELKTPFKPGGRVTAATSSQLSDGAAAVLLASRAGADRLGLTPRARIVDQVSVGVDPAIMLTGPIPATRKLLDRTGMSIGDFDTFEVNEAFASVVLAWERELKPDMGRVNPNGGAIALGHPLGATGVMLITKAVHELPRCGGEHALVTMCCGGGLGTGTLLRRI